MTQPLLLSNVLCYFDQFVPVIHVSFSCHFPLLNPSPFKPPLTFFSALSVQRLLMFFVIFIQIQYFCSHGLCFHKGETETKHVAYKQLLPPLCQPPFSKPLLIDWRGLLNSEHKDSSFHSFCRSDAISDTRTLIIYNISPL